MTSANFAFGIPDTSYIEPLWYITAMTTILSGLGYMDGSGLRKIVTKVKDRSNNENFEIGCDNSINGKFSMNGNKHKKDNPSR